MAQHPLAKGAPGFYVYEIVVDGVVRYIGKGCGERAKEHVRSARRIMRCRKAGEKVKTTRFYNRLIKAIAAKSTIEIRIVDVWECEADALGAEIAAIAAAPNDQLWNTFSGGQGFTSEWIRQQWADPAYREKRANAARKMWEDPEFRARWCAKREDPEHRAHMSTVLKAALADPAVRKKMSERKREALKDPEYRAQVDAALAKARASGVGAKLSSERLTAMWADPERRAAHIEKYKKAGSNPERRLALSARAKAQFTPENRRRASETQKEVWRDPEYRARQIAARRSPEFAAKFSASRQKYLDDPEWRKKLGEAIKAGKAAARRAKCST